MRRHRHHDPGARFERMVGTDPRLRKRGGRPRSASPPGRDPARRPRRRTLRVAVELAVPPERSRVDTASYAAVPHIVEIVRANPRRSLPRLRDAGITGTAARRRGRARCRPWPPRARATRLRSPSQPVQREELSRVPGRRRGPGATQELWSSNVRPGVAPGGAAPTTPRGPNTGRFPGVFGGVSDRQPELGFFRGSPARSRSIYLERAEPPSAHDVPRSGFGGATRKTRSATTTGPARTLRPTEWG